METVFMILAIGFAVVMLFLLPKYAKFIHQQPKAHMEKMREKEAPDGTIEPGKETQRQE